ncbi:hypothetical protein MBLNU459_g3103t2 [Dothideomycetes sp. NU459]
MSLLNSILSSINGSQEAAEAKPSNPGANPLQRKDNAVAAAATIRPQPAATNAAQKRKAEDSGRDVKTKVVRTESNAALAPPPSRSATSSPAQRQTVPPSRPQMPYRGSVGSSNLKSVPASSAPSKLVSGAPAASGVSAAAPKGGYLGILERARAAQAAAKEMGQIKHKPVEKLTKKDRLRMQAEAAAAAKGKKPVSKVGGQGLKSRSKSAEPIDAKNGAPLKERRKPVDVGYKGTMRAAPGVPSYSGTMRPQGSTARKPAPSKPSSGPSYRYADYSDEEDEEDEEENYDSESDMEAGMDEVDYEEEESARIARKEDAEALRLETQLKREKAEKKRKLEQMAAAAAAKKKRY